MCRNIPVPRAGTIRVSFDSIRFWFKIQNNRFFLSERLIGGHFCLYISGTLWTAIQIGTPRRQEWIAVHRTYHYTPHTSYKEHVRYLACHTRIELPLFWEEYTCTYFAIYCWNSHWYKVCPIVSRHILVFFWSRIC